jgi:hypothetical protein
VVGYDLVNRSVGKDLAIAINSDLANLREQEVESDTTLAALDAAEDIHCYGEERLQLLYLY